MNFTLYTARCSGNAQNTFYPDKREITDEDSLQEAVSLDHVCAAYKNSRRNLDNFIIGNVDVMDCDNDFSDDPAEWITPELYAEIFPEVSYVVVPSRHDGLPKGKKSARPRHHVYFPHGDIKDVAQCTRLKERIHAYAPFFDGGAMDAARFIFGCSFEDALLPDDSAGRHLILWHEGCMDIEQYLDIEELLGNSISEKGKRVLRLMEKKRSDAEKPHTDTDPSNDENPYSDFGKDADGIREGSRNNTLSRYAARVLKRFGNTDKAKELFERKAETCDPPLSRAELKLIWGSAVKFLKKVERSEGYIPPNAYDEGFSLRPDDYSDIGQAKVLSAEYEEELVYTDATDYMRYDGTRWVESKQLAVGACEEFLDLQLTEAQLTYNAKKQALLDAGIDKDAVAAGGKALAKAISQGTSSQDTSSDNNLERIYNDFIAAVNYRTFAMKRRDMKFVTSALQAAKPMLLREVGEFDSREFLLNTPDATYDLRYGTARPQEHKAEDLITRMTAVSPDDKNLDLWLSCIDNFFCGDKDLIDYVQQVAGTAAVGKVFMEALIIAYGEGSNGKSTFWNAISRVLGSYSGSISADALTVGCKRNVNPEKAELKGKRLVIAAELEEGVRLNTSMVKQLCSTDEVTAEKKYKDPFRFTPTHTLVLYTNHLPRVGAIDDGTWRRLIVIPFNAKIEGKSDIKNYADYLVENAGGAILSWIMEGAKKAIANDFHLTHPKCVEEAIGKYRENNDWLAMYLDECCELDPSYTQPSGELYSDYRAYCTRSFEFTRSTTEFYKNLESAGFRRTSSKGRKYVHGLRLKEEVLGDE